MIPTTEGDEPLGRPGGGTRPPRLFIHCRTVSQCYGRIVAIDWRVYLADPRVDPPPGVEVPRIPPRMPFVVGDDGSYAGDVNRWIRQLPSTGARSPNTWLAYARDVSVWLRFLSLRGTTVWAATDDDVAAFHAVRRLSGPEVRVSASSWNRSVSALDRLYEWGVEERLIARSPFKHRIVRSSTGAPIKANQAKEKGAREGNLRFLALDRYLAFRNVGLRGLCQDGSEDLECRIVTGFRNALFADLLVTTGMRLQECGSLLVAELPVPTTQGNVSDQKTVAFALAPAICKGGKGRLIRLPVRLARELNRYVELDRASALRTWKTKPGAHHLEVTSIDQVGAKVRGQRRRLKWSEVGPEERRRLVVDGESGMRPLSLWVGERGGRPISPAYWTDVFDVASRRCQRLGVDVRVTPHMLRHTFAVHTLSHLVREVIAVGQPTSTGGEAAYRRVVADPLRTLQELLGHSDLATTHQYLRYTDDAQALVDDAVSAWTEDIVAVAQHASEVASS